MNAAAGTCRAHAADSSERLLLETDAPYLRRAISTQTRLAPQ